MTLSVRDADALQHPPPPPISPGLEQAWTELFDHTYSIIDYFSIKVNK